MELDVKSLLDDLGGAEEVRSAIMAFYGPTLTPEKAVMDKWVLRKSMPGKWLVRLAVLAEKHQVTFRLAKYALK